MEVEEEKEEEVVEVEEEKEEEVVEVEEEKEEEVVDVEEEKEEVVEVEGDGIKEERVLRVGCKGRRWCRRKKEIIKSRWWCAFNCGC
jgi:hypothetical protein